MEIITKKGEALKNKMVAFGEGKHEFNLFSSRIRLILQFRIKNSEVHSVVFLLPEIQGVSRGGRKFFQPFKRIKVYLDSIMLEHINFRASEFRSQDWFDLYLDDMIELGEYRKITMQKN